MKPRNKYFYEGPVMLFDRCICNMWRGETMAVSEAQARRNLVQQFKRDCYNGINTKISLAGKVILAD